MWLKIQYRFSADFGCSVFCAPLRAQLSLLYMMEVSHLGPIGGFCSTAQGTRTLSGAHDPNPAPVLDRFLYITIKSWTLSGNLQRYKEPPITLSGTTHRTVAYRLKIPGNQHSFTVKSLNLKYLCNQWSDSHGENPVNLKLGCIFLKKSAWKSVYRISDFTVLTS